MSQWVVLFHPKYRRYSTSVVLIVLAWCDLRNCLRGLELPLVRGDQPALLDARIRLLLPVRPRKFISWSLTFRQRSAMLLLILLTLMPQWACNPVNPYFGMITMLYCCTSISPFMQKAHMWTCRAVNDCNPTYASQGLTTPTGIHGSVSFSQIKQDRVSQANWITPICCWHLLVQITWQRGRANRIQT